MRRGSRACEAVTTPSSELSKETAAAPRQWHCRWVWLLIAFAIAAGAWLRFADRADKPMHTDEATQAMKFQMLTEGRYDYSVPEEGRDHHGPASLYLTMPVKWWYGVSFAEMTESQLRLVPAFCGLACVLLLFLARDGLTRGQMAWGMLFLAVSPVCVFYSRYYIMEMLLAASSLGCILCMWRWFVSRSALWLIGAGICAGVMHGSKETCAFHFIAMGVALAGVWLLEKKKRSTSADLAGADAASPAQAPAPTAAVRWWHVAVVVLVAVFVSAAIYSQGFKRWDEVIDSYAWYFQRGQSRASGEGHAQPFFHYVEHLWGRPIAQEPARNAAASINWTQRSGLEPSWRTWIGEPVLVIFAGIGIIAAFVSRSRLLRFLAIYGVVLLVIYSFIPYKTPWLLLGPWSALLIVAGAGAHALVTMFRVRAVQAVCAVLVLLAGTHALRIAFLASRATQREMKEGKEAVSLRFATDTRNPYNYSMTSYPRVDEFVRRVRQMATLMPADRTLKIVQADPTGGWPLPWHLRTIPGYHWTGGPWEMMLDADIVIASPEAVPGVPAPISSPPADAPAWFQESLRPHTEPRYLTIWTRKALWDQWRAANFPADTPVQR